MKYGKVLGGIEIKSPEEIKDGDIVIVSSQIYQDEIIRQLSPLGAEIIKLYPAPEIVL